MTDVMMTSKSFLSSVVFRLPAAVFIFSPRHRIDVVSRGFHSLL
jgi:hypothetical protein